MKKLSILAVLLFTVIFYSCGEDSVIEPPPVTPLESDLPVRKIADLPADPTSTGSFTYFRLKDSSIVTGDDTLTNKWDIAFRGTTIWINGTITGSTNRFGIGGAMVQNPSNFDTVSTAPTEGFAVDTSDTQLAIRTGSGNGWYTYNPATNIISAIPSVVLIIITGDGKCGKLLIENYYLGGAPNAGATNSRYYTFKYTYQPDGSTKIK